MGNKPRYYYNNIPLITYCKEHNYSYKYIMQKINKAKRTPELQHLTIEEITHLAITNNILNRIGRTPKFNLQNSSLRKYCLKNNIEYRDVITIIYKLKKEDNLIYSKEDDLIYFITNILNETHFYMNIPLEEYCAQNDFIYKKIMYKLITQKLNKNSSNVPTTILLHLIINDLLIKKNKEKLSKRYFYNDIPFPIYCRENNLNYSKIANHMNRLNNKPEYQHLSKQQILTYVIKTYYTNNTTGITKQLTSYDIKDTLPKLAGSNSQHEINQKIIELKLKLKHTLENRLTKLNKQEKKYTIKNNN